MIFAILIAATLARPVPAGVYGFKGDRWDNGRLACPASTPSDLARGFAHRTLPCGAQALLCGSKGCIVGLRVDSGPYGVATAHGYAVRRRLGPGEHYRGEVDLRPETAKAIGWRGGPVLFRPL